MKIFNFNPHYYFHPPEGGRKHGMWPDTSAGIHRDANGNVIVVREFFSFKSWFTHYKNTFKNYLTRNYQRIAFAMVFAGNAAFSTNSRALAFVSLAISVDNNYGVAQTAVDGEGVPVNYTSDFTNSGNVMVIGCPTGGGNTGTTAYFNGVSSTLHYQSGMLDNNYTITYIGYRKLAYPFIGTATLSTTLPREGATFVLTFFNADTSTVMGTAVSGAVRDPSNLSLSRTTTRQNSYMFAIGECSNSHSNSMSTPSGWNNVGGSPLSRSSYEPMRFGASYLSTPNNNSNYTVNFSSGGMSGALIEVLSEKVSPVPSFIRPS